jgi:DNA repair protein RadA/Sms
MAKQKTAFYCQSCGAQSAKWLGKCPACGEWNTYVEEVVAQEEKKAWKSRGDERTGKSKPVLLGEIESKAEQRLPTSDQEFDRVLGGGIVPGSLVLIGGEPGIGKSTLLLQLSLSLADKKILYVSGEESEKQIKMRADRMAMPAGQLFLLTETTLERIFDQIKALQPEVLIVDSIQTLYSDAIESTPGSISQVRYCAGELMKFAKETDTPVFLIGHITKEGSLAGPKVLEHMVDTVIQFEGDRHLAYRILRTTKNRFGSTAELGIYEMQASGLRQVSNPSEILISQREGELSGITVGATLEGNRPLLLEIQSLVSTATYGTPQRSSTGFDAKRLNMLLAVLEKRGGYRLGLQDVFLNIAGGLKVDDPAIDLAVCASVVSSYEDIAISEKICFAAEVGLGGEVRAVNRIENRIAEAEKLGFDTIYISSFHQRSLGQRKFGIQIHSFSKLSDVLAHVLQH